VQFRLLDDENITRAGDAAQVEVEHDERPREWPCLVRAPAP
jgi:hypothetical protein